MPRMRSIVLGFVLACGVAGCQSVSTSYTPHTSAAVAPVSRQAVRFYPGDLGVIAGSGAQILGRLEVSGYTDYGKIKDEAALQAASAGGTHFILDEGDVGQRFALLAA